MWDFGTRIPARTWPVRLPCGRPPLSFRGIDNVSYCRFCRALRVPTRSVLWAPAAVCSPRLLRGLERRRSALPSPRHRFRNRGTEW